MTKNEAIQRLELAQRRIAALEAEAIKLRREAACQCIAALEVRLRGDLNFANVEDSPEKERAILLHASLKQAGKYITTLEAELADAQAAIRQLSVDRLAGCLGEDGMVEEGG